MPRTRSVVVTGGAGFIGSHVCVAFRDRGYRVIAVDDLSTGRPENVCEVAELEELDILNAEQIDRLIGSVRPRVVCHLAAQASVTVSTQTPERDLEVNVRGTFNVLEAAAKVHARLLFASTGGALYGDGAPIPTPENVLPRPLAPYGASKWSAEAYVSTWGRLHGIPNAILRLGNVYGPRQSPHTEAGVVAIFSHLLHTGGRPTVYGDGLQTRDYIHVHDVARAFLVVAESDLEGTFNVGRGAEKTVLELLEVLDRAAGTTSDPRFEPLRPGELKRSALDSSRLRRQSGWSPTIDFADGLTQTYRTYR